MDRLEEMKECVLPFWATWYNNTSLENIKENYEKNSCEIIKNFLTLIKEYSLSIVTGWTDKKNIEVFIIICYLRSALLTNSYEFEISICKKEQYHFIDEDYQSLYWKPEFFYSNIAEAKNYIEDILRENFIRLKKFEIVEVQRNFISWYWQDAKWYFKDLIALFLENEQLMSEFKKFEILYGEHMGFIEKL